MESDASLKLSPVPAFRSRGRGRCMPKAKALPQGGAACESMNLLREPDAGDPHVRFDEREVETAAWPNGPSYRAHPRLYLCVISR